MTKSITREYDTLNIQKLNKNFLTLSNKSNIKQCQRRRTSTSGISRKNTLLTLARGAAISSLLTQNMPTDDSKGAPTGGSNGYWRNIQIQEPEDLYTYRDSLIMRTPQQQPSLPNSSMATNNKGIPL